MNDRQERQLGMKLNRSAYEIMLAAARAAAPLEACGLLAGTGEDVVKCYVLTNADASPEHFSMKPEEQFAAVKDMRTAGLTMLGIWHSHPASPARMSAEDMRLAYTQDVVYVILSLSEPSGPRVRAFVVRENVAHETPVIIEEQKGGPS
ncbi:MAG: Mov34/MPN/PAD-1 family protein [Kiritimatiellia bacterium]